MAGSISTSTGANPLLPTFNIGGLASGLDTNTIVQQLMQIAQLPQQRIINQQTLETTRQSDLQAIQTQLTSFSSSLATLISPTTWSTGQQITSSDPTHITASGAGVPPGGFQVSVSQIARAQQLTQQTSLQNASADDTLTIKVGAAASFDVAVKSGDSLQTIASNINQASATQVYASVVNSKLVLSSQVTGSTNTMAVSSTGTLATDLGLSESVSARDATYTVDGGSTQTSASNIITSIASGLNVTLLGTTSGDVSVNVSTPAPNTDAVTSAIQDFVTNYNQTIDMITAKVNEQKVVNPQNDADRAKGDLQGDPSLLSLLSQLREAASNVFTNAPSSLQTLAQAGLSTGAAVGTGSISQSSLQGDLTLDTTALSTALTTNFSDVKNLFTNVTNTYNTEGLVQRLNGVLNGFVGTGGIINSQITSETQMINDLADQKAQWDVRLTDKETALRAQYTAMETAMGQAQSQGQWLSGQVSSLAGINATASSPAKTIG